MSRHSRKSLAPAIQPFTRKSETKTVDGRLTEPHRGRAKKGGEIVVLHNFLVLFKE
jgi:hypothetical protein